MGKARVIDAVAAYDRIAFEYTRISQERRAYLEGVERAIVAEIPLGARSLLDVGAGDGRRGRRVAAVCGIGQVVLVEPSEGMRNAGDADGDWRALRAEELGTLPGAFDVVLCLWNVLGHVRTAAGRVEALREMGRLGGLVFIDLNHRYNARHYGFAATVARYVRDLVWPGGDVVVRWKLADRICETHGHVFTDREFRRLAREAGMVVRKRLVIDYATGEPRRRQWEGSLLYVLARA